MMNKEWVEKRNNEQKFNFTKQLKIVLKIIQELNEENKDRIRVKKKLVKKSKLLFFENHNLFYDIESMISLAEIHIWVDEIHEVKDSEYKKLKKELTLLQKYSHNFNRYKDSKIMEFDGSIIITDPCYIIRRNNPLTEDDWDACLYGEEMENLGIKKYMTRNTIYGDWSCTTFNSDNGEKLGEFCADSGMVSVFDLDEVLSYNPDYKNVIIERPWTVTLIKNFKGTVQFVVKQSCGVDDNGGNWKDYSVQVVGHGVDKTTGNAINFVGKQTGF